MWVVVVVVLDMVESGVVVLAVVEVLRRKGTTVSSIPWSSFFPEIACSSIVTSVTTSLCSGLSLSSAAGFLREKKERDLRAVVVVAVVVVSVAVLGVFAVVSHVGSRVVALGVLQGLSLGVCSVSGFCSGPSSLVIVSVRSSLFSGMSSATTFTFPQPGTFNFGMLRCLENENHYRTNKIS